MTEDTLLPFDLPAVHPRDPGHLAGAKNLRRRDAQTAPGRLRGEERSLLRPAVNRGARHLQPRRGLRDPDDGLAAASAMPRAFISYSSVMPRQRGVSPRAGAWWRTGSTADPGIPIAASPNAFFRRSPSPVTIATGGTVRPAPAAPGALRPAGLAASLFGSWAMTTRLRRVSIRGPATRRGSVSARCAASPSRAAGRVIGYAANADRGRAGAAAAIPWTADIEGMRSVVYAGAGRALVDAST